MGNTDDTDYENEPERVSDAAVQKVRTLAKEMADRAKAVKEAEAAVEARKKRLAEVRDGTLPAALQEMGIKGGGGIDIEGIGKVTWDKDVYGSLPSGEKRPEDRAAALAWFEENAPGLIKRKLVAMIPRQEPTLGPPIIPRAQLKEIGDILKKVGVLDPDLKEPPLTVTEAIEKIIRVLLPTAEVDQNFDIHAQTLMSWARGQIEAGKQIPFRLLGLTPVDKAKISAPRARKTPDNGDL
jgi:hypothetical protein